MLMRTFLDKMRDLKLEEVAARSQTLPESELRARLADLPPRAPFAPALQRGPGQRISLITEVKARAPGRENVASLDLGAVLRDYEAGGAQAVSVLTDGHYFGGALETLEQAAQETALPLLHKEFIVHPYQLLEGRVRGASAALILAYYFSASELQEIVAQAEAWGLDAVVECSLEEELPRTLEANPRILMINNRPIASLPENPKQTYHLGSVEVTPTWWKQFPELRAWKSQPSVTLVSASCIGAAADLQLLESIPCDAALIGNSVMSAPNRVQFLQALRNGAPTTRAS